MSLTEHHTLSVTEAGRRLGVSRCTAYRLVTEGKLPALRLGRKLRIPVLAFEAMLTDPELYAAKQQGREAL